MANWTRSRSSERPGPSGLRRGDASPHSRRGRAFNEVHPRADRRRGYREHRREYRSDSPRAHFSCLRDDRQRRFDELGDRRPDVRRVGEDAGRREQRHGMSSANSRGRPSDSRANSRQRDDWCTEDPRRDQQGRHGVSKAATASVKRHKDNWTPLLSARGEVRQGPRPPASKNHGAGGRPSAVQIQLNKRIVGARNFEDAIVEAEKWQLQCCQCSDCMQQAG
jgi:hypothetical protein